jgi:spore coat protein U-like protein
MKSVNILRTIATVSALALGISGLVGQTASAATATANLAVSATVSNNCTISTTPLAFTPYDPVVVNASVDLDGTGTVVVACTKGTAPTIGLGLGSNSAASVRRMHDGSSNYLTYELYQDSGRATIWSTSGLGLLAPVAAPSKAARNFTVYGRVASNQDVPAGSYTDTVVATVNF